MQNHHAHEIALSAVYVMLDDAYSAEQRDDARRVHDVMVTNLFRLAEGDAEARSSAGCHVHAVWTPLVGPFVDLIAGSDYEPAELSFHS